MYTKKISLIPNYWQPGGTCGGGVIHRQGLSETILLLLIIVDFLSELDNWAQHVAKLRQAAPENALL